MTPFQTIDDDILVFDIESVPCIKTGNRIFELSDKVGKKNATESDKIDELYDKAGIEPEGMLKTFMQKIVSVAGVKRTVNEGTVCLKLFAMSEETTSEEQMITAMMKGIARDKPQLVGFASHIFDLPILSQRALVHGISNRMFFNRPAKPWEGQDYFNEHSESHIDLMKRIGKFGSTPKLHEIAQACGIPGKLGTEGAAVKDMYLAGNIKAIEEYNVCDALTTYLLWLNCSFIFGLLTEEQLHTEQALCETLIEEETPKYPILERFLQTWRKLGTEF